jgi:ABC-2 type transport system ATP-binding protein
MNPTILTEPLAPVFGPSTVKGREPSDNSLASDVVALEVHGVKKAYGSHQALRGVSFQVMRGERIALLGPNGAGKTTLIRCISGRVRLDEGRVQLFGKPTTNPFAFHSLGVVPQDLAIYQDLTARENLECFGRLHGLRGRGLREQVSWALRWIALEDRADELTARFSGGMKRRVNIACGVMHKPGVLLLDEPTVGVDPQSRQRIFDMLDELSVMGTSIVLTTHHLDEAEERSDRIVIVDHGTVIADGTIQELLEQTVGSQRRVVFEISGQLSSPPDGLTWDESRKRFSCSVHTLLEELPDWISKFEEMGGQVHDLEVHTPNLHHVFLHLTGRELRD